MVSVHRSVATTSAPHSRLHCTRSKSPPPPSVRSPLGASSLILGVAPVRTGPGPEPKTRLEGSPALRRENRASFAGDKSFL
jgi:hypothetical protein